MPTFLMCEPTYFSLDDPINPWMGSYGPIDLAKARVQWAYAKECLERAGARIVTIPAQPNLQDMTFCADAGIVYDNTVLLANYKYGARQLESPHFLHWFSRAEYNVRTAPRVFEGGDVVRAGTRVVCGTGIRSDGDITATLRSNFPLFEVVGPLKLVNPWFYHLDTAFTLLDEQTAVYYPGAFSTKTQKYVSKMFSTTIPVSEADASNFALNIVQVDRLLFLNTCSSRLEKALEDNGYRIIKLELTEFLKSGGSIKCLTLRLD